MRTRIWNHTEAIELMPRYSQSYINNFRKTLHVGDKMRIKVKHDTPDGMITSKRIAIIKAIFPHVVLFEYKAGGRLIRTTYQIKELALKLAK